MQNLLIINKPSGWTSNDVVQRVKHIMRAKRAGHAGTLDPMATGVLLVLLNEATKRQLEFLGLDKQYRVTLRLGQKKDTGDRDGQIVSEQAVPKISEAVIRDVLTRFLGAQAQLPPRYSAIKYQGVPLHRWARRGQEVPRESRQITIHRIELEGFSGEEIRFFVHCSKGTYVRVLGEEIAEQLGTVGHLTALCRTACGPYGLDQACRMEDLSTLQIQNSMLAVRP